MLPKYPAEAPLDTDEARFADRGRSKVIAFAALVATALAVLGFAANAFFTPKAPTAAPVATKAKAPPPTTTEEEPLELPPLSAERTLHLESTLLRARALFAQDKAAEAVALFEAAIAEGPSKPPYQLALSRLYLDAGQLAPAFATAERVSKQAPWLADSYLVMGTVLQLQDAEWARTKQLYEKYLELAPNGLHAKDVKGILARRAQ
jgi:tetratricopeptide (TPR) repeat protein